MTEKTKVLFLSPEAVPFAKTGGLADVAGALPPALKRLGLDVRLVLPLYRTVHEKNIETTLLLEKFPVPLGTQTLTAKVLQAVTQEGIPFYLIEREDLYDRPNLYGNSQGDYYDNLERFTFFCHAALRLAAELSFYPDVIHCHDWQTALVSPLLKGPFRKDPKWAGTPVVLTIHNLGYQGIFPEEKLPVTGLPKADFFHMEGLEFWGNINLLKAGIVYSSAITAVSPAYAREIRTPEYGEGLEGVLQKRKAALHGILNGADYSLWDPARDSYLRQNYSPERMEGKPACKKALIEEMGMNPGLYERPLLGMITRLDRQKGLDLILKVLDDLFKLDLGLIILGSGDKTLRKTLERKAKTYHDRLGLYIGFDEPLAHRIMAGADLFLIPSRYEPCGLTQMYALKYGTIPLVRATGGLDDSIVPFDPLTKEGNGFKFIPYDPKAFLETIREAVRLFADKETWTNLMVRGMQTDFSWDRSAKKYFELYQTLVRKSGTPGTEMEMRRHHRKNTSTPLG